MQGTTHPGFDLAALVRLRVTYDQIRSVADGVALLDRLLALRCAACQHSEASRRRADGTPICDAGYDSCAMLAELADVASEMMQRIEEAGERQA